jgi:hypothetical protein
MTPFHQRAVNAAATHFVVCLCLFGFLFMVGFGAALSDSYHPDPLWFTGLSWLLYVLEAPVAIAVWLSHRIAPSSHPTFALYLGLGVVWSLVVGYVFSYVRGRLADSARAEERTR